LSSRAKGAKAMDSLGDNVYTFLSNVLVMDNLDGNRNWRDPLWVENATVDVLKRLANLIFMLAWLLLRRGGCHLKDAHRTENGLAGLLKVGSFLH
jgi:hypothetical protein